MLAAFKICSKSTPQPVFNKLQTNYRVAFFSTKIASNQDYSEIILKLKNKKCGEGKITDDKCISGKKKTALTCLEFDEL